MQSCFFLVLSYMQCILVYLLQYLKDTINIIPQTTTRYAVLCENRVTQIWKIVIQLDFTHKYEYFEVQHTYDFSSFWVVVQSGWLQFEKFFFS